MQSDVRALLQTVAILGLAASCHTQAATTKFTGTAHPVIAVADQIARYEGISPPDEHKVIGVVTAHCATLDGATGEQDAPCSKPTMIATVKQIAAKVGGSAVLDVRCNRDKTDHAFGRIDGGAGVTTTRALVICQATVLRHAEGRPLPSANSDAGAAHQEQIRVSGTPLLIGFPQVESTSKSTLQVGVLEQVPAGYPELGIVKASCLEGCARASARRGLQHAAVRANALAIAAVRCQLVLERWHCAATAVGRSAAPSKKRAERPDAGVSDASAEAAAPVP